MRERRIMSGMAPRLPAITLLFFVFPALVCSAGCSSGRADQKTERAGVIFIDSMTEYGPLERPAVAFPHDQHTAALATQEVDCETCHLRAEDGTLLHLLMQRPGAGRDRAMDTYHEHCIGCHEQAAAEGRKSGPLTCGECHREEPVFVSIRQPIGFDKSLHHRHVQAHDRKCEQCHHVYDEAQDTLVYVEGQETTCRECHLPEPWQSEVTGRMVPSLSTAAHRACLGCHMQKEDAGPGTCAGCHDPGRQKEIETIEDPMRLERGQPDFTLISAPEGELDRSKLPTVPFSHIDHEEYNSTCRVCHHESMKACTECHTIAGHPDARGIKLQQAFHDMESRHSCVGCHDTYKKEPGCAGCHSLMGMERLSEHACRICHTGPRPGRLEEVRDRHTSFDPFQKEPEDMKLSFPDNAIPDSVTIGVLKDEYEAVTFPHGRIVTKLLEKIEENRIAVHFHGHQDVVCQGCHHRSPAGIEPPLCESCHGDPFNESFLHRPGLKAAYHQQCLGCHEAMGIKDIQDCSVCHTDHEYAKR